MLGKHRGPGGHGKPNTTYIALIVVAVVLIAGAFLILSGSSGNTEEQAGPAPTTTKGTAGASVTQKAAGAGTTLDPASITVPTTVAVSNTGAYIRVQYLGSYKGTYTADGEVHNITSSGDRLFTVNNSSQTVTVNVRKTDRSSKQTLIAEIWKNGIILSSANTTALYGEVSVTAAV